MKRTLSLALLFVLLSVGLVFAQGVTKFYASWGIIAPLGPKALNYYWEPSYKNVSLGTGFDLNQNIEIFISINYQKFLFDKYKTFPINEVGPVGRIAEIKSFSGSLNAKYKIPIPSFFGIRNLKLYGVGGAGAMRLIPVSYIDLKHQIDFTTPGLESHVFLFQNNNSWFSTGRKAFGAVVNFGGGISHDEKDGTVYLEVQYVGVFPLKQNQKENVSSPTLKVKQDANYFMPIRIGWIFKLQ
jgi:hypothetical protein